MPALRGISGSLTAVASLNPCHTYVFAHVTPPSPQITRDRGAVSLVGVEVRPQLPLNVAGGICDREVRGKGFRSGRLGGDDPGAGHGSAGERDAVREEY